MQAKGSSAVAKYCTNKKFKYAPTDSIADSICAGAPRNLYMAFNSIVRSNGCPVIVTDNEILSAQKYAAQNYGILIEPSSAASLAGFIKYNNAYKGILKTPMLLFTGNGLKDTSALIKWNKKIKPLSSAILKKKFHGKK